MLSNNLTYSLIVSLLPLSLASGPMSSQISSTPSRVGNNVPKVRGHINMREELKEMVNQHGTKFL